MYSAAKGMMRVPIREYFEKHPRLDEVGMLETRVLSRKVGLRHHRILPGYSLWDSPSSICGLAVLCSVEAVSTV